MHEARLQRAQALAAAMVIGSLLVVSCGQAESPAEDQGHESSVTEPGVAADGGYWRDESLPEPLVQTTLSLPSPQDSAELATASLEVLSLDRDGDYVRLVMAWLPPVEGPALGSIVLSSHKHRYEATPFIRLVDRESGELIEPLRGDSNQFSYEEPPDIQDAQETPPAGETGDGAPQDQAAQPPDPEEGGVPGRGTCICSMLSGAAEDPPERTELIFVDFPAPKADSVDIVPGEWAEPIRDVPVSTGEPFARPDESSSWFFTHASGEDPPAHYGAGARYAVRYPVAARTEDLNGVTTTIEEETQEVSLPSDVLFEFGSAELTDEAAEVIESAAEKLNEEAAGFTVTVEGHTDNVGSAELNQQLSEDRARAVAGAISEHLEESITLETVGYGFSRPQVPNTNADGDPIPENQARNRRVSFRYPVVVQEAGVEIDLDQAGLVDLPTARQISAAEGAAASFVLEPPEGDTSETALRFDVLGAERHAGVVTMRFALAAAPGNRHHGTVFTGNPERGGRQHFGHNPQGDGDSPGLANMSLIDIEAERQYFPLSSGDRGCLCTEVAGTVENLPSSQSPMYAQFHLPEAFQGQVLVYLPDSGQFALPPEVVEQMTDSSRNGTEGE